MGYVSKTELYIRMKKHAQRISEAEIIIVKISNFFKEFLGENGIN